MSERISVCIPTCDRPEHVEEALQSVLVQDPAPYEVLIGDDSSDRRTTRLVQRHGDRDATVRHLWNEPSLGQAKNVDRLFREAEGDYVVLLHDDDRLLDGALDELLSCFIEHPDVVAAFGKQEIIGPEGTVRQEETEVLNEAYHRTSEYEGVQSSALRSAVIQQFPNDGYMVQAQAAKKVGYDHGFGDGCDIGFGVKLARSTNGKFYFTDTFTAQYRQSEQSVVRGEGTSDAAYQAVKIVLEDLPSEVTDDPYIGEWLRSRLPVAIMRAADEGYPKDGLRWFFSSYHRRRITTPGGARRLLHLIYSYVSRWVTSLIRRTPI